MYDKNAKVVVNEIIEKFNLTDVWREFHETEHKYTWKRRNPTKMARLDYFLISEDMLAITTDASILAGYRTDHNRIIISLQASKHEKGRGYWKFNNLLLSDKDFINMVKDKIRMLKDIYAVPFYSEEFKYNSNLGDLQFIIDDQLLLNTFLTMLRGDIISFSSNRKKKLEQSENLLNQKLEDLDNKLHTLPDNEHLQSELDRTKQELETLRQTKIRGIILRSKARWYEMGEKSTHYFCNLENRNYTNKLIHTIERDNGEIIQDQKGILNE